MISKLFDMVVAFVAVFAVFAVFAGDSVPPILQCGSFFKKGIYMNFEEFLNNSPSKKGTFVKHNNSLKYRNKKGKTRKYIGKMWGYTGGQTIYVKYNASLMPVTLFKYHSLLSNRKTITMGGLSPQGKIAKGIDIRYTKIHVLDMKNGNINRLTKELLIKIIDDDKELLKRFDAEEDKKAKLAYYIIEYNKRKDSADVTDTLNMP